MIPTFRHRAHVRRQVLARSQATSDGSRVYARETTKTAGRIDVATAIALGKWLIAQKRERLAFGPTWETDGDVGV